MLPKASTYEELAETFRWTIPEYYNIGVDVCDKWADNEPDRLALTEILATGEVRKATFGELKQLTNRMANLLRSYGAQKGDRIGVLLPQSVETAASHIAIYKMGAIAVPLFLLFGPDALQYRIGNAGIKLIITNREGCAKLREVSDEIRAPLTVFCVDGSVDGIDFIAGLAGSDPEFEPVRTRADDPALIIYTSGTTGSPKGALHAHRVLLGHLPGVEMSHDLFPHAGDTIWTPADWAWIGGLLDVLMPALHHGIPVIARRFEKFTGEAAYELMSRFGVTNVFLPPTALKMMRATPHDPQKFPLKLRAVASGGETLGPDLLEWGRKALGVTINEFYGQTECNMIVSSCSAIMTPKPGVMGRAVPGHHVAIVDAEGKKCRSGETGQVAVHRDDPVMFLEYWRNPVATDEKFTGEWMLTGDMGVEEDGWLRFIGRDDDVITSSGYRIGPGPIEDCLLRHSAVKLAAVVGKPDPVRTEIVTAFLVLKEGVRADENLKFEIQTHVRNRLAAHEFPREVHFVSELPMTATGKLMRRVLRNRLVAEDQND